MAKTIYLVIPCYNEEEALPVTATVLEKIINGLKEKGKISEGSSVLFVNDGSKDNTWNIICELNAKNPMFKGINLSRNKGHQNALLAGLMAARDYADAVISMDADLQDDVGAIERFIDCFREGNDIVYGVRSSREKDTFFKKYTAESFYKIMRALGVDIVFNHADYRLMSKRALEALAEYDEVNLFLRGIIPEIGFNSAVVEYERNERVAGESKYPLKKMISFALDGITSFSIKPIRMVFNCGIMFFLISAIAAVWAIIEKSMGNTVPGWSSLMVSIWFVGGAVLLGLGIVGEYIGKIYSEVKRRPRYIIKDKLL